MKLSRKKLLWLVAAPVAVFAIGTGIYLWQGFGAHYEGSTAVTASAPQAAARIPSSIQDSLYSNSLLDFGYSKSSALEALLNEKATRIINAHLVDPHSFRVNSTVFFRPLTKEDELLAQELQKKTEEEKVKAKEKDEVDHTDLTDQVTLGRNDLFNLSSLLDRYRNSSEQFASLIADRNPATTDKKIVDGSFEDEDQNPEDQNEEDAVEPEPQYIVTQVHLTANISKSVSAEQVKQISKDLEDSLAANFGKAFKLSVNQVDLTPVAPLWLTRWNEVRSNFIDPYRTAYFALFCGLLGLFMVLGMLKFWSERSARIAALPKVLTPEEAEEAARVAALKKQEDEARAQKEKEEAEVARKIEEQKQKIFALEEKIVRTANKEKKALKNLMLDWSTAEDHVKRLVLLMDVLARNEVDFDRTPVGIDRIRKIRKAHTILSEITPEERTVLLDEIHWSLVSTSLLGEKTAEPSLAVANSLSDVSLSRFLSEESAEMQGAILLSLDEARAAKLFGSFGEERRSKIMEEICVGKSARPELIEQGVRKLNNMVAKHQENPVEFPDQDAGVHSLTTIVKGLDFDAQFVAAKGLLSMSADVLTRFLANFFNVSLLSVASDDFLMMITDGMDVRALQAMVSEFGNEFKTRLVPMLPPMQKAIVESTRMVMPKGERMQYLKQLDADIQAKLASGKIAFSEIYDLQRLKSANKSHLSVVGLSDDDDSSNAA